MIEAAAVCPALQKHPLSEENVIKATAMSANKLVSSPPI
jgi:hypothetical protein